MTCSLPLLVIYRGLAFRACKLGMINIVVESALVLPPVFSLEELECAKVISFRFIKSGLVRKKEGISKYVQDGAKNLASTISHSTNMR